MIFIVVKFKVKPDWTERWPQLTADFTAATRGEEGNLWFDWSRSLEDPNEFVLVEAFKDDAAAAHVNSDHFQQAMKDMLPALVETPQIINTLIDGEEWSRMGELEVK
ncbi:putative quinol monooxygenase [Arthrobacter koreensis]|jgi:quinol monooxygenase YgiN|uniref:Antibiotic biosynthesis monooxygenase n=1 Tax=Arthrobacter koreensis TaxID=199136 RepID=A0ABY6FY96_9MICC|nr:putative quinol monooxygenase [Arthrobacter koreensis]MDF2496738.1 Antibiotic biosynthesis monooxygenase [Arthrobacter koreensis]MEB7447119.1 antibiotic biosynthesis monooxygenase [Arthrobacter koreensis]UYB37727.1 antibiotic biosynthesis monooxygenase [Arthrobacter koreensis]